MDQEERIWSGFHAAVRSRRKEVREKYFAGLYGVVRPKALGLARKLVGKNLSAKLPVHLFDPEDVFSEVYCDLVKHASRIRVPRNWFYDRFYRNVAERIRKALPAIDNMAAVIEHESAINADPQRISGRCLNNVRHLRKAVRELPPRSREVIMGLHYDDESPANLARRLGIREASVRRAHKRAVSLLRASLVRRGVLGRTTSSSGNPVSADPS